MNRQERSNLMKCVKTKHTRPEMVVRSILHKRGFRYRLHRKDLPGNPDIVLPKYKTVVLVQGCFWHQHKNCRKATLPKTNVLFWAEKLSGNAARDRKTEALLKDFGWKVVIVWECETKGATAELLSRLTRELVDENAKKRQME